MESTLPAWQARDHRVASVEGLDVRITRGGRFAEEPRPIVFVHGEDGSGSQWNRVIELLVDVAALLVTYDLRGPGRTSPPAAAGEETDVLCADLAAIVRSLRRGPALIVSHGAGAAIAMRLATSSAPLVAGILMVEPRSVSPDLCAASPIPCHALLCTGTPQRQQFETHPRLRVDVVPGWSGLHVDQPEQVVHALGTLSRCT
jgi:pimeloyl-ACP methyl ester carboxylesterase